MRPWRSWPPPGERERFDIVVVDPHSRSQRRATVGGAFRAYGRLTDLTVHLAQDGRLLLHAPRSSRVSAPDPYFLAELHRAARDAGYGLGTSSFAARTRSTIPSASSRVPT